MPSKISGIYLPHLYLCKFSDWGSELFSWLNFFSESNFLRTCRIVQCFGGIQEETFISTHSEEEN